jgi:hypothetical protein
VSEPDRPGVTFVIPVRNGEQWLDAVIGSILAQADGRPMEVLAVEDGSRDRSTEILARYAKQGVLRVIPGPRRGVAAALNEGIRQAAHPIICQVDQDVVLESGWITALAAALDDPRVAAAQGYYVTPPKGTVWARVMGLDLEDRYRLIVGHEVNHVCTGNSAYRTAALKEVGLFDEALGYGADNDMSYRLTAAGYRLVIRGEARSIHHWRDGWWTYLVQQYGFGYGRLDLVAKHRGRLAGDDVSRWSMMLHAPLMAVAIAMALLAIVLWSVGSSGIVLPGVVATALVVILAADRLVAGLRAAIRFRDPAGLLFAPMHLLRDVAWAAAIVIWSVRRMVGIAPRPSDSMRPREPASGLSERQAP